MKYFLVLVFVFFHGFIKAQQKAMLTQHMFNGLAINPSYSALNNHFVVAGIHRQQWVGFPGAPNTQIVTMHTSIGESNTSAGAMLFRDNIGTVVTETGAYFTVAQRIKTGIRTYIAGGFMAGLSRYTTDYTPLKDATSATDPTFNNDDVLRTDFGLGIIYFSNRFYAGISSPFLSSSNFDETMYNKSRAHYMAQGGLLTPLGDNFKSKNSILFKYVRGAPLEMDLSQEILLYERVWVGISWRSFDSFDGILQVYITPNIHVGYAYDLTTTKIGPNQKGSHEIMLKFSVNKNFDPLPCYW